MADVDVIVIGSGAGGLTAAVAMARAGKRVCVLEQHYLPGGWCHSFNLGGYRFSPGVHYIGEMAEGGRMRRMYEGLGVAEDLTMMELNPDGYDQVRLGSLHFQIPRGFEAFMARLQERFPAERDGIDAYLNTVRAVARGLDPGSRGSKGEGSRSDVTALARWGWRPLQKVLDAHLTDPALKAILTVQAGDHGMPADRCAFGLHAAVTAHYFEGAWYPQGGGRSLPRAFIRQLKKHGGQIRTRAGVQEILFHKGRVVGVRLQDGEEIRSDVVLSNADPAVTFGQLVPREQVPLSIRTRLNATHWSLSALSLFMAFDGDPRAYGLDSGNLWYAQSVAGVGRMYAEAKDPHPLDSDVSGAFLTVTSLKDPAKQKGSVHTMEAFSFISWDAFNRWRDTETGGRPEAYEQFKDTLANRMLDRLEDVIPDLRERLVFQSVGTPLTNRHYCMATRGNLYGTEKRLRQLAPPFGWGVTTPIPGLYLCGASTIGHGIAGATISGIAAAAKILNCRGRDLLGPSTGTLTLASAEQVATERARDVA